MVELHHGDCLDVMRGFDANCIDLTVTSPPYDNLRTYNGSLNDWTEAKWKAIIAELFRVTKQGGVVVWVVGDATVNGSETWTSFKQALWAMECGFRLHDTMIWAKDGGGAVGSNYCYTQNHEFMFVFSKGRPASINIIRDKPNQVAGLARVTGRRKSGGEKKIEEPYIVPEFGKRNNWWLMPVQNTKGQVHPAVFPEALARDHIQSWSNEGDVVLDPFLGSGTTGKMALAHGRSFIGIERDADYFRLAKARIEAANDNRAPDLFANAA